MTDELQQRLDVLLHRLRTTYDGIGHSSGRPYVYFVYPPEQERAVQRLVAEQLRSDTSLAFHHLDLLPLTIQSLAGQEERRQQLLNDPLRTSSATEAIMRLWARAVSRDITNRLEASQAGGDRPVVVLRGLAALHPLGNPTTLMEFLAEHEPRNPRNHTIVPIILFIPGLRPPQTSRRYLFLGQERLRLDFYRGEEM
jgi:hypothetical protein